MSTVPDLSLNDRLAAELRTAATRKGLNPAQVARQANLPPLWVHARFSGLSAISVEDLVVLCAAMDVSPLDVLGQILTAGAQPSSPPAVAGT